MFPLAYTALPIRGQNEGTCAEHRFRRHCLWMNTKQNEESWLTGSPSASFRKPKVKAKAFPTFLARGSY